MSDTLHALAGTAQAAFSAMADGSPAVYVVEGRSARQAVKIDLAEFGLAELGGLVTSALAPNGTHLAYCVSEMTLLNPVLKLLNLQDGSNQTLTQHTGKERYSAFAWKPDSSQLVYLSEVDTPEDNDPDLSQIWAVAPGSAPVKLYGDDVLQLLGWSADGAKIYFTRRVQGAFSYSALHTADNRVEDIFLPDEIAGAYLNILGLTYHSGTSEGAGALLGYTLNSSPYLQNAKNTPVMIVKADSGDIYKQITTDGAAVSLIFSPDQTMLAYSALQFDEESGDHMGAVRVFNLNDGSVKELMPLKVVLHDYKVLCWAADNSGAFVATGDGGVVFVDFDGNQTSIIDTASRDGLSVGGDLFVSQFGAKGAVVNLDLPYLHQVKMVPEGFDGNWACNACSCIMVAAYYGKLAPRNDTFRGNKSEYGWYASSEFASPADSFVFSRAQNDPSGRPARGGYGTCTEGGDGYAWRMVEFLKHLGLKAVFRGSVTMGMIKEYLNDGKPIVLSTNIKGFGHLVALKGYMPDGRLIVNDPYWARPGAGEIVYTWGELGTLFYMITVDDAAPAAGTPSVPVTQDQPPPQVVIPQPQPQQPPPVSIPEPVSAPPELIEVGTGNEATIARFKAAFDRGGGEGAMGKPAAKVFNYNQRWIQDFKGGARGDGLIMLDERFDRAGDQPAPTVQPAFGIYGAFLRTYRDNYGGSGGALGSPVSEEFVNLQGDRQQNFEGGYITMQGTTDNPQGAFPWPTEFNAWKAEYFNNTGLAGKPTFTRDEPPNGNGGITYNWGNDGPEAGKIGVLGDNFAVRYNRAINFGDGGIFTFNLTADDGFRFLIDGQNLAGGNPDQFWVQGGATTQSFRVQVGPGVHTLTLEYLEISGGASVSLDIAQG